MFVEGSSWISISRLQGVFIYGRLGCWSSLGKPISKRRFMEWFFAFMFTWNLSISIVMKHLFPLHWRHNERDGVSNHRRLDYLLDRFIRRRSKKTSKFRVTGLCAGNSPLTGDVISPCKEPITRTMFPFDDVSWLWYATPEKTFQLIEVDYTSIFHCRNHHIIQKG